MLSVCGHSPGLRLAFGYLSLSNTRNSLIMAKTRQSSAISGEDGIERPSKRTKLDDKVEPAVVASTLQNFRASNLRS